MINHENKKIKKVLKLLQTAKRGWIPNLFPFKSPLHLLFTFDPFIINPESNFVLCIIRPKRNEKRAFL